MNFSRMDYRGYTILRTVRTGTTIERNEDARIVYATDRELPWTTAKQIVDLFAQEWK